MSLRAVPDGEGSVRSETQLALFGESVDVPIFPRAEPDPAGEQGETLAQVTAGEDQMELFLLSYPAEHRRAVVAGLYFDADGAPRTRHRMLRAV